MLIQPAHANGQNAQSIKLFNARYLPIRAGIQSPIAPKQSLINRRFDHKL